METDVTDGGSRLGGGRERAADDGLIDVAEACVVLAQQRQCFGKAPGGVTYFDDKRIVRETFQQCREIRSVLLRAMKREGELKQNGAEFACGLQDVETGP